MTIRAGIAVWAVDSTDSVLCETFILLAQNPTVQKNAYEEARRVIGDDYDTPMRSEDVSKLTCITMVLKETMRLIPPVAALESHGGNGFLTLHHDPKVFPKPEQFIPERFLPENVLNRHRCSYLPFSAWERICIGEKYVMPEMKFTVAKILYKYEIFTKMETDESRLHALFKIQGLFNDSLETESPII
ncbi:cytochrome P450 4c3-like [Folsomia candida]|uniref:cytochrome P450 4c3-like n=1 Tax=Folsomia candida TaxID=158441 RepID=UPI001604A43A|nr:cytochrome P450 4c3-like [Folsomia candida]